MVRGSGRARAGARLAVLGLFFVLHQDLLCALGPAALSVRKAESRGHCAGYPLRGIMIIAGWRRQVFALNGWNRCGVKQSALFG